MTTKATILAMGAGGDGIATIENAKGQLDKVFVPFTLPGEEVTLAVNGTHADVMAVLMPSPERIDPVCRHFTSCGGCSMQHWQAAPYRVWKTGLVSSALQSVGIDEPMGELLVSPPGSRRRAIFTATMTGGKLAFGFNRMMSHSVEPIEECAVMLPAIVEALPALRALSAQLSTLAKGAFSLSVTATETGLDVCADKVRQPDEALRRALIASVLRLGFARLAIGDDIIVEARPPVVSFGGLAVSPPSGGFLQATVEAEHAMQAIVTGYFDGARKIADLYCGSGTFALPLARRATVHAVESQGAALNALDKAWRNASGLKMRALTTEKRDLAVRPLMTKELDKFDAVVIDPPRAGAETQMRQLAKSAVKRIAAVSCNPQTLARDLKILSDGGYGIVSITPIDQFLWTPHVEVVALLARR
jgi:23S rRNA (uracil1939-C5)-methyltransferase